MPMPATSRSEDRTNEDIQRDVLSELEWDPRVSTNEIGVTAKDGVVALTGEVDAYAKRWAAEDAALRVRGVKAVANDVEVRLSPAMERTDEELAAGAIGALEWDALVPKDRVKVKVSEGWITLIGEVDWYLLKVDAERVIRRLMGVRGVTNLITIKPVTSPEQLKVELQRAFIRSAKMDSDDIEVEVLGNRVVLTGSVKSAGERDEAERVTWLAPGVSTVDNRIEITYD